MIMKSKAFSSAIVVCLYLSFGASAKADTWQPSPEIKMAAAGMKDAVANVKYMRARVIYTDHLPSQISDFEDFSRKEQEKLLGGTGGHLRYTPAPPITKIDTIWQIAGGDMYLKKESFRDGDTHPDSVTTWKKNGRIYNLASHWLKSNPKKKATLFVDGRIAPIRKFESRGDRFLVGVENSPLRLAFKDGLADSFLQKRNDATFKGYETIDGNKCMKIETHPSKGAMYTWWINVNHGFVVYRWEQIGKPDGMVPSKSESQASHMVKYGKTWLPQKIVTKIDWNVMISWFRKMSPALLPESLKGATTVVPPSVKEYTIQDVSITEQPIPPVIWPLGTSLRLNYSGDALIVTAINKDELTNINRQREAHNLPALHEYPIGAQKPGMIGVALKDAEVKQLKKWRTLDVR